MFGEAALLDWRQAYTLLPTSINSNFSSKWPIQRNCTQGPVDVTKDSYRLATETEIYAVGSPARLDCRELQMNIKRFVDNELSSVQCIPLLGQKSQYIPARFDVASSFTKRTLVSLHECDKMAELVGF